MIARDTDFLPFVTVSGLVALLGLLFLLVPRVMCFWNRRPGRGKWYAAFHIAGWLLLLGAFLAQLTRYGIGLFPLGILAGAGLILNMLVEQKRRGQREVLLRMISTALARRLPLAPVLETFGRDAVGWSGDVGAGMGQALNQGMPLDQALERAGDPLGDTAGVLVRVGRETHNIHPALKLLADIEEQSGPLWRAFAARVCYLAMLMLCITGVVAFGMMWIVPSMEKIFREFAIELPLITRVVVALSNGLVELGGGVIFPLALSLPLLYAGWRFVGHSRRDLSRTGRIGMPLHRACILESLSLAAEKEWPLENATALLAAIYPRRFVRNRLAKAHMLMEQGRDWLESLREASLLRVSDVAALRLARESRHLTWTLRELATASRRRFLQRVQALGQFVFPLVLLCLGLSAGAIAVAMFLPLVILIKSLT